MKKKILISGINGFLGSHLAKHLCSNFEIIGLEYSLSNLHRIQKDNYRVYSTENNSLESIFEENNLFAVIHVATVYRRNDEPILNLLNTNINLPIQLLELSNKNNIEVFLNTDSFFNNPKYSYSYLSDYTLSKKHSLEWIKLLAATSTCKVVNMKIFHMFGKEDSPSKFIPFIVDKIKSNETSLDLTPGNQTRDFIYVKDVVTAFECVVNSISKLNKYQEFDVGTGVSYTIKDLVLLIKDITTSKIQLNFGAIPYREGEIMDSKIESYKLNKLGWKPKYSLKKAVTDFIHN